MAIYQQIYSRAGQELNRVFLRAIVWEMKQEKYNSQCETERTTTGSQNYVRTQETDRWQGKQLIASLYIPTLKNVFVRSRQVKMERLYHSRCVIGWNWFVLRKMTVPSQCTLAHTLVFTYVGDAHVGVWVFETHTHENTHAHTPKHEVVCQCKVEYRSGKLCSHESMHVCP